jgi:hypothetical protein
MKLQASEPLGPKSLQSQIRPWPQKRLSINRLGVVHRQRAKVDTDQLARSFTRGRGGPASSAAFRASFICKICIIRFFLAGALLAFRANVSTDGRIAFRALLISSYA